MPRLLLLFFLALAPLLHADDPRAKPYLLPADHPAKAALDRIFAKPARIIASKESLRKEGGFYKIKQGHSLCYVAKHKKMQGFLLKTYTDAHPVDDPLAHWIHRIEGANAIRHYITRRGLTATFTVPRKWVYPLPYTPPFDYALVVEEVPLLSGNASLALWSSGFPTAKLLSQLFTLLTHLGLYDSVYVDNIPFSRDQKIAFIDTEHHGKWPVPCSKLTSDFRLDLQPYWDTLITRHPDQAC